MYVKIFESKEIRLTNHHYKLLLKRFDSDNFKRSTGPCYSKNPLMKNNAPCSLCKSYFKRRRRVPNCGKCSLRQFENSTPGSKQLGCSYILEQLAPTGYVYVLIGNTSYWSVDERNAMKELKVITDFLKSFEKE